MVEQGSVEIKKDKTRKTKSKSLSQVGKEGLKTQCEHVEQKTGHDSEGKTSTALYTLVWCGREADK